MDKGGRKACAVSSGNKATLATSAEMASARASQRPPPGPVRVFLRGEGASGAALFGDGQRLPAALIQHPSGEACLEAEPWQPGAGVAVLGLAVPAPVRAVLIRLELPA